MEHLFGVLGIVRSVAKCFNPFGHIVHCYQNIFCISRLWEWSHEVYPPDIKQLHLEVVHERHCIPYVDASMFLASSTSSDKFFCILVHRWPEESALPDLGMCTECSVVSSIGRCMISFYDLCGFNIWDTSPQQPIGTDSVEVRVIPQVGTTEMLEFSFVLPWCNISCNHIVDNICIPRIRVRNLEESVVPKIIVNG